MACPQPGVLHTCRATWPTATAFEFGVSKPTAPLVLFVGGTGGTLMSTAYLPRLARGVEAHGWAFAQVNMVSTGGGWGGVSVVQDAVDIAAATAYFKKRGAPKIVLLGLSTGAAQAFPLQAPSKRRCVLLADPRQTQGARTSSRTTTP